MNTLKRIWVVALFIGLSACSESEDAFFSANDEIIFQVEYINYAWGKQHYGFLITPDGTKHTYNNPEGWFFSDDKKIGAEDFLSNLTACTAGGTVDLGKLNQMKALVLKVDENQLTTPQNTMKDAGSESYSIYVKDEQNGTYRQVILSTKGDWSQKNKDKHALEIVSWLVQLNNGGIFKD